MCLDVFKKDYNIVDINEYKLPEILSKDPLYAMLEEGQGASQAYSTYYKLFVASIWRNESGFLLIIQTNSLLKEALYYVKNREYG